MDFFKSILSEEDPDPQPDSPPNSTQDPPNPNPDPSSSSSDSWSFGGFMKTLSTRSESVIETYRRDLEEFRTGLQRETELLKEVATRAVKELPGSIESTAEMIKSTAEMIASQGNNESESESDGSSSNVGVKSGGVYSRFEAQLRGIQCDVGSYVEDPEDAGEYEKWKEGFELEERREEVERIRGEGGEVEGMFGRLVVSGEVDERDFWCRYFFRVWELRRRENVRERLVKRAIEVGDEEELSWDVDDDEEDGEENEGEGEETNVGLVGAESSGGSGKEVAEGDEGNVVEGKEVLVKDEGNNEKLVKESDQGVVNEVESNKESNVSAVPARTLSREEEDLEWDEIDDVEGNDEKKVDHGESASKTDTGKRLSVAEEDDEDLSWDIEDDDEPEKANAKQ
nr:PREDICTED: BSD domain-containing protein 1-like isoform X2 [Daucus carota subsp. sativus]